MTDRICHRGPDAAGLRDLAPQALLQLGHRRLSIIDLSAASDQPFVKRGLHLSYNGELYNYRELRNILRGKGVQFDTGSDTEVVLEAWRQWGADALPRFRGMFAFALYDERTAARLNCFLKSSVIFIGTAYLHRMKLQVQFSCWELAFFPTLRRA